MKIMFEGKEVVLNNREDRIVYNIWCDNTVYTGSGKAERISGNHSKLRRGKHATPKLQEAYILNEDGSDNFKFEILYIAKEADTDEVLRRIEQYEIEHLKQLDDVIVANCRPANNGATSKSYNKYSRLTEEDASHIKELIKQGYSNKQLAYEFDCSSNTISKIRHNNRWVNA